MVTSSFQKRNYCTQINVQTADGKAIFLLFVRETIEMLFICTQFFSREAVHSFDLTSAGSIVHHDFYLRYTSLFFNFYYFPNERYNLNYYSL